MSHIAQMSQQVANIAIQQEQDQVINGWVSYIALGTFRIDDGQSIEYLYPPEGVSAEEKKSIAMISFPDTQSLNQGNDLMIEYCFRMKIRDCQQLGFVFFFRKKDPSTDRGYIQKSIIIITKLPLIHFYQHILNLLGEFLYENKTPYLNLIEKAIADIQQWPDPENSKLYKLQFMGQNFTVSIPQYLLKNRPSIQSESNNIIIKQKESSNQNSQNNVNEKNQRENSQFSSEEMNINLQKQKSNSHNDFRLKNNLQLNDNMHQNIQLTNTREDYKNLGAHFFSTKNTNNKIVFQDHQQGQNIQQQNQDEVNSDAYPNIEIRSKQRSNSLETQQEYSLNKQIKQKNNLTEILKLNDAQEEGLFQEINVFRHVSFNKLHLLWPIWEMILINQPFLLTTNTPSECSAAILGFISLISPLQFAGDYRPYFTVYDTEYKKINLEYEQNMLKSYVLGTCNPLFQMTLKNFPVIIGFDSKSEQQQLLESKKSKKPLQSIKYNKVKSEIIADNKQLEKLLLNCNSPEAMAINNTLVRKHFRVLTNQFLDPINKYLDEQPSQIKIFEEKAFMQYLKKKKSTIQHLYKEKNQLFNLYERFLRSLNFIRYIKNRPNTYYQNPFIQQLRQ
ncbi:polarity axis stabilization protein (macronuclear) [Tetrahymena thermophila SB210]|uniref:Polarity axis stabilization protein n=1 Tax=Tetrahymena thermophila (strain SB210) TaxID=312017 RepID=I7MHB6_TETTS|nr:polarity axis stabilization protein [Tetrahymena thermophila SB210]EAS02801.2 polarity axis stabilization protein [Tetrahymena thermophila SB210]|eukprot:XP_001023046.2 polarity axis stabilization protein [Tetrahymena thermophila SB210]